MSWQPAEDPKPGDHFFCDAIETMIIPRSRDIGSFEVRRAVCSSVGTFVRQVTCALEDVSAETCTSLI